MNLTHTRPELNPPKHPEAPTAFVVDSDTTLREGLGRRAASRGIDNSMVQSECGSLQHTRFL